MSCLRLLCLGQDGTWKEEGAVVVAARGSGVGEGEVGLGREMELFMIFIFSLSSLFFISCFLW